MTPLSTATRYLIGERSIVIMLMVFALAARILIAAVVPPWQSPDEPKHFEYIRLLVDKRSELLAERRLLTVADASPQLQSEILTSMARNHWWEYLRRPLPQPMPRTFTEFEERYFTKLMWPLLYYYVAWPVLLPFQAADVDLQLLVVRIFTAILSALAVLITYLAARELTPRDRFVPTVAATFVATLPMHVFIGGTANTDNSVTLAGAATTLLLTIGLRRGFGVRRWALVVVALAATLAAKRTSLGMVPAVGLAGLFWLSSLPARYLRFVGIGIVTGVAMIAAAFGSGLAAHALPIDRVRRLMSEYALNQGEDQLGKLARLPFFSAEVQGFLNRDLDFLFLSFWGIFGWFSLYLSRELYRALLLATGACAIGLALWLGYQVHAQVTQPSSERSTLIRVVLVYLAAVIGMAVLVVLSVLIEMRPTELPQGRYLFSAIVPIAVLYALGARAFLPSRFFGTWAPTLLAVLSLVALDVVVYVQFIVPFYVTRVWP